MDRRLGQRGPGGHGPGRRTAWLGSDPRKTPSRDPAASLARSRSAHL